MLQRLKGPEVQKYPNEGKHLNYIGILTYNNYMSPLTQVIIYNTNMEGAFQKIKCQTTIVIYFWLTWF